jgi:Protein of unknown function (DUF3017)
MANKPANAGSSGRPAPPSAGRVTPAPRPGGHRAVRPRTPKAPRAPETPQAPATSTTPAATPAPNVLAWVPYLLVLAGAGAGLLWALHASWDAGRGAGLMGGSLLAAGLARLVLPPRYAGLLSSRGKASDVLAFAVLGAGVLALALMLP